MTFLHYFAAAAGVAAGVIFGALCGIAAFLLLAFKGEQWWLKHDDQRWERQWERWWQSK